MNNSKKYLVNFKWKFIIFVFAVILSGIIVQLYRLQIVQGEYYRERVENQFLGIASDFFDRENIYFLDKNNQKIAAATLKTGYTVSINPKLITNPEDIFNLLSLHLEIDEERFISRAFRDDISHVELAKDVDSETAEKISELGLVGVFLEKNKRRYYPGDSLASHVIGFLSFKENDLVAQYGLERFYDDFLNKKEQQYFTNFFAELFSSVDRKSPSNKQNRASITITMEPTVQGVLEKEMKDMKDEFLASKTGAIIMNPMNGEIYAMAISPDFDLNNFREVDSVSIFNNDLVESVYEMGSIVKPLTVAIGLERDVINANSLYEDTGAVTLNNATIRNYDLRARGTVTMQEALNFSLNTAMTNIVTRVGNQNFADHMKKIFEGKTEIDLPNESTPLLNNLYNNRDIELATASFGQGIAMSPISITRALASLGNGGLLVKPHFLKEINYATGISKKYEEGEPVRVFKKETSEEITRMLVAVVDDALLGGTVALPNHTIAAKTGTAQMVNPENGKYYEDKYMHTFFGYFPAYDPKFIIFMFNIEPQRGRYASETLTVPFMNMAKFLINYYNVSPDR